MWYSRWENATFFPPDYLPDADVVDGETQERHNLQSVSEDSMFDLYLPDRDTIKTLLRISSPFSPTDTTTFSIIIIFPLWAFISIFTDHLGN